MCLSAAPPRICCWKPRLCPRRLCQRACCLCSPRASRWTTPGISGDSISQNGDVTTENGDLTWSNHSKLRFQELVIFPRNVAHFRFLIRLCCWKPTEHVFIFRLFQISTLNQGHCVGTSWHCRSWRYHQKRQQVPAILSMIMVAVFPLGIRNRDVQMTWQSCCVWYSASASLEIQQVFGTFAVQFKAAFPGPRSIISGGCPIWTG